MPDPLDLLDIPSLLSDEDRDIQATVAAYLEVLQQLAARGLTRSAEVSVKLSAIGQALPDSGHKVALENARMYGLVQKDKPEAARAFLDEVGDPFHKIAQDVDGRASIEWGVYGVPETYVVDGKGIMRFKYVGPITDEVLEQELIPAIRLAQANP